MAHAVYSVIGFTFWESQLPIAVTYNGANVSTLLNAAKIELKNEHLYATACDL